MKRMPSELFEQKETMQWVNIANVPITLYQQDYDWTCPIACLRSVLFALSPQNIDKGDLHYISTYNLFPKPYFSKDFKEKNIIENELASEGSLAEYSILYGCDKKIEFDDLVDLLRKGYFIMTRYVYNHHWCLILGFFNQKMSRYLDDCHVLLYDSHFNKLHLENAADFEKMWRFPRLLRSESCAGQVPSWYLEEPEGAGGDYIALGRMPELAA